MAKTDAERQQTRREKMYESGFKLAQIWIKRKNNERKKISINEFMKTLKKMTFGWNDDKLSNLLNLFIKITKAKKEEEKLKER